MKTAVLSVDVTAGHTSGRLYLAERWPRAIVVLGYLEGPEAATPAETVDAVSCRGVLGIERSMSICGREQLGMERVQWIFSAHDENVLDQLEIVVGRAPLVLRWT